MERESKENYSSWKWTDAHFYNLPTHTLFYPDSCGISVTPQTNVYGHAKVIDPDGSNKFLVGSRVGKVSSLENHMYMDKITLSSKVIPFSYIPAGAELVSLDVISKSAHHKQIVVGITLIKFEEESDETEATYKKYLNLYSLKEEYSGFDNIDECSSQSLDLDFVPYQLTHTSVNIDGKLESVFLLVGSDNRIHTYREDSAIQHSFHEYPTENCFPELNDISSCIHWMDIVNYNQYSKRLIARGHRDGEVTVTNVDINKNEILNSWTLKHDSCITSIKIFTSENNVSKPTFITNLNKSLEKDKDPELHVLVLGALEPAAVYRDVLKNGLKDPLVLPHSNKYDIPLCQCIIDIDFDGCNEILIGTYGQELLAYKFIPQKIERRQSAPEDGSQQKSDGTPLSNKTSSVSQENLSRKSLENLVITNIQENQSHKQTTGSKYRVKPADRSKSDHLELLWQKSFACPVMGVDNVDIMGDGMEDLVVVTLKGVHIIQPDLQEISKVCLQRMNKLIANKDS